MMIIWWWFDDDYYYYILSGFIYIKKKTIYGKISQINYFDIYFFFWMVCGDSMYGILSNNNNNNNNI